MFRGPADAIVRVTSTDACRSDPHSYEVLGPYLHAGDLLGHEPMGIVEEVGREITAWARADRDRTDEWTRPGAERRWSELAAAGRPLQPEHAGLKRGTGWADAPWMTPEREAPKVFAAGSCEDTVVRYTPAA